ncbi:hypothetical protein J2T50_000310 [Streptococcus gallinaceus]|uniref:phage tail protein n=1 Tax=Streptococcus gallinaceus TaxID=165758 RepID=UPI00209DE5C6|nr:phage tail protein [Streptococcus gallinaceus]MCP1638617.1 hypothetical protein [Streptococcus gallinaceus]MCP1769296.1 hypothetical protein [Streptococcus gallinaceus]
MYSIYVDNEQLYHPHFEDYSVLDAELKLGLNESGILKVTIPKSNPSYGKAKLMKSLITVYDDGRLLFRGRPYAPTLDLFQNDMIECEGELAFFNDSMQEPFNYSVGDVATLFRTIITNHNNQVEPTKQFMVGNVTVRNDTEEGNIVRSSDQYLSTWKVLKEKFLDLLGGYLWIRHENNRVYIDYLADLPFLSNQTIEQCVNLMDAKKEMTSHELATVILPVGAKVKDADGRDTDERLTLQKTHGYKELRDEEGIKRYGVIKKIVVHDHITTPERLLQAGKKDLAEAMGLSTKYTLTAADLSKAGVSVSPFLLGTQIPIKIPNFDLEQKMLVRSLSLDLLHPEKNILTIGTEFKSYVQDSLKSLQTLETVYRNLEREVKSESDLAVVRAVREANSNISQSANEIRLEVADGYYNKEKANELLEQVKTLIKQTATSIEFLFHEYKREQGAINGNTASKFAEITKYIRFEDGDILLGETNNPITLRIENDKIVFRESGVDTAYWKNRKFYAVDGEFLTSLKLGKFAFIPRETGNLSFTKVVN